MNQVPRSRLVVRCGPWPGDLPVLAAGPKVGGQRGAGWSSSVARWAHNPEVAGSNPAPATSGNVPGRVLPGTFFMPDVPELYQATRVSGGDGRAGGPSSSAAHRSHSPFSGAVPKVRMRSTVDRAPACAVLPAPRGAYEGRLRLALEVAIVAGPRGDVRLSKPVLGRTALTARHENRECAGSSA